MIALKINNATIQVPSKWDELNRHYLELIAGMSVMNMAEYFFKSQLLFHGAGILIHRQPPEINPKNRHEKLYPVTLNDHSRAYLTADQVMEMCNLFNFLFRITENDKGEKKMTIDSRLTVNLIPKFKVSGTLYYGPANKLFNVTLSEFIHAETNLGRYEKTKETEHLDRVIAILYRPQDNKYDPDSPDYKGDRRTPFNDHRFEERAGKIRRLNHNLKLCIYLFYQGCQWWYRQQFPHVFGRTAKTDNNLGFLNLVDALTGGDVTKTAEIHKTLLTDVMVHLERAAIENEILENKMKKK